MKRALAALLIALAAVPSGSFAQTTAEAAADGKAFGQTTGSANQGIADVQANANEVPNYVGNTTPQSVYFDDPDKLVADRATIATTNPGYRAVVDGNTVRPRFAPAEITATLASPTVIANNPAPYATGVTAGGATGQCVELPPAPGGAGTFEASCNIGANITTETRICPVTLQHSFTTAYKYQCTRLHRRGRVCLQGTINNCTEWDVVDEIDGDACGAYEGNAQCTFGLKSTKTLVAGNFRRTGLFYETFEAQCSAPVAGFVTGDTGWPLGLNPSPNPVTFTDFGLSQTYVSSARDESQCASLAGNGDCTFDNEICTDSTPVTRNISGTDVTQPCWAWTKSFTCTSQTQAQNCDTLAATPGCVFTRDECLDDPQIGACKVTNRVYTCPIPGGSPGPKQFVCGGDIYCVGTVCEPIVREASDEFKDAVVGLHALDQAGKEFNEADFMLFKGLAETCSKPVFGLGNCCGGNGFPLIGVCSAADRALAVKIDKGYVHFIGTYCGKSFLGICTTKRNSYCSFQSKLTRMLQEQGRPQIGKSWGTPKKPICDGFTIDEFASLDLSVMDFTEIYSDFVDAAKLPDEVQVLVDIQTKISTYYTNN